MNLSQDNLQSTLSEHQKQLLNHIIKNGQKQEKNPQHWLPGIIR